ncbi:hypothetical protein HDR58_04770 [bacterium]|nr:hypothetical protein [bacterium]
MNQRYAGSTIKGFLYQFEKTLNEILTNIHQEDTIITVEGIEDIDLFANGHQDFIQCKYHEKQEKFQTSIIEKPIIQMLHHWCHTNQENPIRYKLFCYFTDKNENDSFCISVDEIKYFVNKDTPEKLQLYKEDIKKHLLHNKSIVNDFCARSTIEFGLALDNLREKNIEILKQLDFTLDTIDDIVHPNALFLIHKLAINKNIDDRKISVKKFLFELKQLDKVLLWKYTKYLSNYKQILTKKRKFLHDNLNSNQRARYFVFDNESFDDYANSLIIFIKEYLDKFQYKNSKLHISNNSIPTFILFNDYNCFKAIYLGLKSKNINSNIGFTFDIEEWTEKEFFKNAVINLQQGTIDFRIRLLYIDEKLMIDRIPVLHNHVPDDLFLINTKYLSDVDLIGCNKEILNINNINELKYVLNMVKDYD